ncbi:inactive cytochrome P450 76AD1-like [Beta vulgaris subsp. vulgaris]|uniref:inactive cytochrome P450 76AD1-like n=1 Tax=Beta vulgaris subsp. vulgaris TaxID=3555 RepID=UPI00203714A4|nr:inactive cytochrome P450 76AD1-like [Beta vulgaris subsp. vulgaris]
MAISTISRVIEVLGPSSCLVWFPLLARKLARIRARWMMVFDISTIHLFSSQRLLDSSQALRQEKVSKLIDYAKECCNVGEAIDVGGVAFTTSLNLLSNTFFSFDLASYNSSDSGEFKELVWKIMEEIGKPNLADCFPMLRFLSVLSVNYKVMVYGNRLNDVFEDIIQKRLISSTADKIGGDVLDTLLRLMKENESESSLDDIKHLLSFFFFDS